MEEGARNCREEGGEDRREGPERAQQRERREERRYRGGDRRMERGRREPVNRPELEETRGADGAREAKHDDGRGGYAVEDSRGAHETERQDGADKMIALRDELIDLLGTPPATLVKDLQPSLPGSIAETACGQREATLRQEGGAEEVEEAEDVQQLDARAGLDGIGEASQPGQETVEQTEAGRGGTLNMSEEAAQVEQIVPSGAFPDQLYILDLPVRQQGDRPDQGETSEESEDETDEAMERTAAAANRPVKTYQRRPGGKGSSRQQKGRRQELQGASSHGGTNSRRRKMCGGACWEEPNWSELLWKLMEKYASCSGNQWWDHGRH